MSIGTYPFYSLGWFSTTLFNILFMISGWRQFFRDTPFITGVDTLPEAQNSTIDCSGDNTRWRTLDGTCNDLAFPEAGSVGTRFKRINFNPANPFQINPETEQDTLLEPNPRNLARTLLFPNAKK